MVIDLHEVIQNSIDIQTVCFVQCHGDVQPFCLHILLFYTTTSVCCLTLSSHADFSGYGDKINSHGCDYKE